VVGIWLNTTAKIFLEPPIFPREDQKTNKNKNNNNKTTTKKKTIFNTLLYG